MAQLVCQTQAISINWSCVVNKKQRREPRHPSADGVYPVRSETNRNNQATGILDDARHVGYGTGRYVERCSYCNRRPAGTAQLINIK